MATYVKPFDASDPNASFVNGNPSTGVAGSIPDALMWEVWQRELAHLITFSGQTPSNGDLTQVRKSIQSLAASAGAPPEALVHYGAATGSANAYTVASLNPAITTLATGMIIEVEFATANTGASTVTLSSLTTPVTRAIVRMDGSPVKQNDIVVGTLALSVRSDGKLGILNYNPINAPARSNTSYRANGTFTVPDGCYFIYAQVWGAGGGGGHGVFNAGTTGGAGAGGGGGGYDDGFFFVTPGQSYAITVGAGGAGGVSGGSGAAGGTSSVGALLSATGGGGGAGSTNIPTASGNGQGGVGVGGNINGQGASGGTGFTVTPGSPEGAAGGIGGYASFGGGSPSLNIGGAGSGGNFPGGGANASANNGAAGTGASGLVRISF